MRGVLLAVAAVLAAAGCSSGSKVLPLAAATSAPAKAASAAPDASWVASCQQLDDALGASLPDLKQIAAQSVTTPTAFIADDLKISKDKVDTVAADAPATMAPHVADVAKALDVMRISVGDLNTTRSMVAMAAPYTALWTAEQRVQQDCAAAGSKLVNVAPKA